jgi:hypothetical protein
MSSSAKPSDAIANARRYYISGPTAPGMIGTKPVQQKSSLNPFREDLAKPMRGLRCCRSGWRRRLVDCRVRLRLVGRSGRRIHYRRIGFFFFPSRRIYCLGFLFTSHEQGRGTSEHANVFLHKVVDENPIWVTPYSRQKALSALPAAQCSPAKRPERFVGKGRCVG